MRRFGLVLIACFFLGGCFHVEVANNSDVLDKSKPDTQMQMPFWWYGFGVKHVDLNAACKGKGKFSQFQLKERFLDGFLRGVTLGIYAPVTGNIHCGGK